MKKLIFVIVPVFLLLASCSSAATVEPQVAESESVHAEITTPTATSTALPTSTNTPIPPTATMTSEPTATMAPLNINYVSSSGKYQMSSEFILNFGNPVGEYYATGAVAGYGVVNYVCEFDDTHVNNLVCKGGFLPFNQSAYIQLLSSDTDEQIYSNMIKFTGVVPSPTGVTCEIEPQWNGGEPAHQRDMGCFAITCFQNGGFFYGDNYTCETDWPFEWDFTHPLYTPKVD